MTIKSMVRWTEEENAQMAEMVAQKMPRKLIARALNRSIGSIRARIEKGMPAPKRRGLSPSAKIEREKIMGIINRRIDTANGFIQGSIDHGVEPSSGILSGLVELRSLLRELEDLK